MLVNTRVIDNEDNTRLFADDVIEGAMAREQVALGNAEEIQEIAAATEAEAAEVVATQAAIDHAEAMGIDISTIEGTGKDGKVTKADVQAAIDAKEGV